MEILVKTLFHGSEHFDRFGGAIGDFCFETQFFGEGLFHFDEGIQKLAGGPGMLDAVDKCRFQALVGCDPREVCGGHGMEVALVGFAENAMVAREGLLLAIQQHIIGTGFGKKLHQQGNRVHEHEKAGQDDVGPEGEAAGFLARFEQLMKGEGLDENVAAGLGAQRIETGCLLGGDAGEFLLQTIENGEVRVDLALDGLAD